MMAAMVQPTANTMPTNATARNPSPTLSFLFLKNAYTTRIKCKKKINAATIELSPKFKLKNQNHEYA
jgi:hypothetical protein